MEDEESELYFEVDTIRKVQGGFHVGNDQTQTSSLPAIITLDYNNAYIRKRMSYYIGGTNVTYHYFIESDTFSDWYKSEFNGYGRPAIVIDVVTDQSTMLRFGGKLLPEAANNFIAKFDWEDYNVLSRMFGTINGMRLVGDTIVVFQDTKVTSFYINKTAIKEADGGQQTILTDKVLNNKMVSEFDFGCINSQSIVKRDTHVLFFDAINGNFVRHSKNGMIDISAYGVSEFSKELGNAVQSGVVDLKGAYNERNDYFYWLINFTPLALPYPIPFPDPTPEINAKNARWKALFENGDNGLAIMFDNKANAWKGFVEMNNSSGNAEMIGRTNSFLTTYIDGQPYVFDSNSFGKTFGIYRETVVEKVINVQPLEVKIFNHLEVNAEDTWLPSETGDVTTDYGHSSRIRFMKEKEGHFYNDIKRNMLFPNGTLRANENLGEILRGNTCTIRLRLASDVAEDEQSTITSIGAGVTLSEKT